MLKLKGYRVNIYIYSQYFKSLKKERKKERAIEKKEGEVKK